MPPSQVQATITRVSRCSCPPTRSANQMAALSITINSRVSLSSKAFGILPIVLSSRFCKVVYQRAIFFDLCVGAAPSTGDHHGRLAVEQAYGYMFHNSVVYGIISTVNSFAFLRREQGAKLNLTRLIPATRTDPTILRLLYYFSNLCATTSLLVETHRDGRPVSVVRAPSDSSIAPLVPQPSVSRNAPPSSLSRIQLDPPRRSPRFQQGDSSFKSSILEELYLDIDTSTVESWLGCKGYKGILHTGEPVFAKLWDGWKHSSDEADRESAIYNALRGLWGTRVPRLIAHGGWGFCHTIVLEFIKVISLSICRYIFRYAKFRRVQFCPKLWSTLRSRKT